MTEPWGRPVAGRLKYNTPPEPGTILGPLWTRELAVVLGQDDQGRTVLGYATTTDVADAGRRTHEGLAPRSLTETSTAVRR